MLCVFAGDILTFRCREAALGVADVDLAGALGYALVSKQQLIYRE